MKFRKRPLVIEAQEWVPGECIPVHRFLGDTASADACPGNCEFIKIRTLEGSMMARPGDFIIRGIQGEYYACKPDIFAATYESAP